MQTDGALPGAYRRTHSSSSSQGLGEREEGKNAPRKKKEKKKRLRNSINKPRQQHPTDNIGLIFLRQISAVVQPMDAQTQQTPSLRPALLSAPSLPVLKKKEKEKMRGQCAALRHLRKKATDAGEKGRRGGTDARGAQPRAETAGGYSLWKRYCESGRPPQDCRCEQG